MLELRYRTLWIVLGVAMVLVIAFGSLLPRVLSLGALENDKVNHLIGYFGLTAWFTALVRRSRYALVLGGLFAFGIAIEVAQHTMQLGRSGDWRDVVANSIGMAAGLGFAYASRISWLERVERWLPSRI